MHILSTPIPDLKLFAPTVHKDSRGFFMETWREDWIKELEINYPFIQDNCARSEEVYVLRGLHFQLPPYAQGKLVWVSAGAVYDVAIDLRVGSPSYGFFYGVILSAENYLRFYLPRGFAHGYMTLCPGTEFNYKVDSYYAPEAEGGLRWDDPDLGITWPHDSPILSIKDTKQPLFNSFKSPFNYQ